MDIYLNNMAEQEEGDDDTKIGDQKNDDQKIGDDDIEIKIEEKGIIIKIEQNKDNNNNNNNPSSTSTAIPTTVSMPHLENNNNNNNKYNEYYRDLFMSDPLLFQQLSDNNNNNNNIHCGKTRKVSESERETETGFLNTWNGSIEDGLKSVSLEPVEFKKRKTGKAKDDQIDKKEEQDVVDDDDDDDIDQKDQ